MARSIPDILEDMRSADLQTRGRASRELLARHADCADHVHAIARFLHDDAAIADIASLTLTRIGPSISDVLLDELPNTFGKARLRYLSLILWFCDLETLTRIFTLELDSGDNQRRFHAANCVGGRFAGTSNLSADDKSLLKRATDVLTR